MESDRPDRSDRALRVERARRGDAGSFEELLSRYQQMAFAYALSLLRDYYLAQDATQEALFIAYLNLGNLKDPAAFPGWLRGIVRHQCCRYLRRRHVDLAPLDEAIGVPEAAIGPEQYLERREAADRITAAIAALPPAQREVSILYYVKDYSQREIAAFLGLPVSTVNNRLHAARRHLKGELRPMADNITTSASAGRDTATVPNASGAVITVNGPVLDARFAPETLPALMAALDTGGQAARVVQRLDANTVRCLVSTHSAAISVGAAIRATGRPIDTPLEAAMVEWALPLLGAARPGDRERTVVETGIKVIDLLCPFVGGDKIGFAGQPGSGKLVLTLELSRNLVRGEAGLSLFTFMSVREVPLVYEGKEEIPQGADALQVVYLAIPNPTDPTDPVSLAAARALDAMVYTSRALATLGLYPAVDPLLTTSRNLDRAVVGDEHYEVAQGVKGLLRRYREIQEGVAATGGTLSDEHRQVVARARRAQRLFTQPFSVAEPFTGRPGVRVSLPDTIGSFKRLLAGDYDDLPEDSFMWRGAME